MLGVVCAFLMRGSCARARAGARLTPRPASPPRAVPPAAPVDALRKSRRDSSMPLSRAARLPVRAWRPRPPRAALRAPLRLGFLHLNRVLGARNEGAGDAPELVAASLQVDGFLGRVRALRVALERPVLDEDYVRAARRDTAAA